MEWMLSQCGNKATMASLNQDVVGRIEFSLRPLSEQHEIVRTLSKYDDLIANNKRRIELLEQSARLLFKEWFVYLRYPGHEHDKIVDGVPVGWERSNLGQCVENFDRRRQPLSVLEREQRPGPFPYHGAAGVLSHINGFLFDGRFLLVGEDGTVITANGSPMLQLVEGRFWVSNHAHVLQGRRVTTELLYVALSQYPIIGHITGVAQPKLTQGNLNRIPLLIPTEALLIAFQEHIEPIIDQIFALKRLNVQAAKARDLLLPRLMDGRLSV